MTVMLRLKKKLRVPINAECVSPNVFAGKSIREIGELQLREGNRKLSLTDAFEIEGNCGNTPTDVIIRLVGNISKVNRIGVGMSDGEVQIQGDVGMNLGEEMKSGKIIVDGNAGSWIGTAMKGGIIEVKKNVGDYIGGAYRGSTKGMQGGTIIVHGNAGTAVGFYMKKGLIKIYGNVDQFAGIYMRNGAIIVHGDAKERAGAFMKGGKIILCGHVSSILPTFTIDGLRNKAKTEEEEIREHFYLFIGDLAEHGNGKLYVLKNKNEHLKDYEELL